MLTKNILESKKLNTVIVDDDDQSRKLLNILLKKFPQVNVVGEASNMRNALDIINEKKPDSIFLDICLGNSNGFELMDKISKDARVVFISAFDDYALKAFEVNALDYIQKPVAYDRLALTIERLLLKEESVIEFDAYQNNNEEEKLKDTVRFERKKFSPELLDVINENKNDCLEDELIEDEITPCLDPMKKKLDYDDRIFVSSDGTSKFIKVSSIFCITAEKDYSYICLINNKKILVLKSMVEWEARLTPKYFARIHRSTIINLEYVDKIERWFNSSYRVYMQNLQEPFQMSRRYAAKLKERFK